MVKAPCLLYEHVVPPTTLPQAGRAQRLAQSSVLQATILSILFYL